jgi:hypothetical protein
VATKACSLICLAMVFISSKGLVSVVTGFS